MYQHLNNIFYEPSKTISIFINTADHFIIDF